MPQGIHEWAQSDRYALAMNFHSNGMNFFKPATYNLLSNNGITGVEFPLPSYLAAIGGVLFGRENINLCFRIINTLASIAGLLFLFKIVYDRTHNFIFSSVTPIFIFSSPIFIFYTCNYLPDTFALSLSFIAYYYFLNFIEKNNFRDFIISLIIITLGTLIKTSIGICLVAITGHALIHLFINRKSIKRKTLFIYFISSALSFSIILGYYLYNQYLNKTYNSFLFLASINPADDFSYLMFRIKTVWLDEYFVLAEYPFYLVVFIFGLFIMCKQFKENMSYLFHILLLFLGTSIVFLAMSKQFIDHDYYALGIFFPFITFSLVVSIIKIFKYTSIDLKKSYSGALLTSCLFFIFLAQKHHHDRIQESYRGFSEHYISQWMKDGSKKLDKLNISNDTPIIVMQEGFSPNLGLSYFDRKGYVFEIDPNNHFDSERLKALGRDKNIDIVTLNKKNYEQVIQNQPTAFKGFELLEMDDLCVIFKII
jgi:hypothetical protein